MRLPYGWCNGDPALCLAWHDGGDRAALGDPANTDPIGTAAANKARQQFYDQNPQLVPFQSPAAFSSPSTEVDAAIQKGLLGNNSVPDRPIDQPDSTDLGNLPTRLDDGSKSSSDNSQSASLNQGLSGPDLTYLT